MDRQKACMILAKSMIPLFVTGSAGVSGNVAVGRPHKERNSRKHSMNGFARARSVREVRAGTARYPRVEAVRLQTLPTGNSNSSSDSGFISMLYPGTSGGM